MTNGGDDRGPLQELGMLRVAVCTPELRVADVEFNARATINSVLEAAASGVSLAVFPELGITGYSCADLFFERCLLDEAEAAVAEIAGASADSGIITVVGAPVSVGSRLYNCGAVLAGGSVIGLVPKSHLPNSQEFYEARWFSPARTLGVPMVCYAGSDVPVGADLLFEGTPLRDFVFGVEICEDLWSPEPPSGPMAAAGATVCINLSASNELIGKYTYRQELVRQQSARCISGYLYSAAGPGESSTDLVFSGHSMIAETGVVLAETERFAFDSRMAVADLDLERIVVQRQLNSTFSGITAAPNFRRIQIARLATRGSNLPVRRPLPPHPFIPSDPEKRAEHCREIFAIQSTGLAKRIRHVGCRKLVIGVSGGLDSALALLVCVEAAKRADMDPSAVEAVVMPGPGSTDRTQNNARALCRALGLNCRNIPVTDAVQSHLEAIGHDDGRHDITFENAQARERTQILMNLANRLGGIVVGTGDLSEAALGWCTFNGDHMSMYHVNAGVPKTLVRHLVEWCADEVFAASPAEALLRDIADTPITPELLPAAEDGSTAQKTEDSIGPYELHDFFLFHMLRNHSGPQKLSALATQAFEGRYDRPEIERVLAIFYRRFFSNQFKRSSMPDGPKVGTVALSPRGDWRMPSDAAATVWLAGL